jgi:hypothetical protein
MHADPRFRPNSVSEFVALLTGWKKYPKDAQLPGNTDGAAPRVTKEKTRTRALKATKKPDHERRVNARYELEVHGKCRPAWDAGGQSWDAKITDISTTGLCFDGKRRFETGSVVEVAFSVNEASAINHLARVRWLRPTADKAWLHGCEFVNAMTDADLEMIFADLMDTTKMR